VPPAAFHRLNLPLRRRKRLKNQVVERLLFFAGVTLVARTGMLVPTRAVVIREENSIMTNSTDIKMSTLNDDALPAVAEERPVTPEKPCPRLTRDASTMAALGLIHGSPTGHTRKELDTKMADFGYRLGSAGACLSFLMQGGMVERVGSLYRWTGKTVNMAAKRKSKVKSDAGNGGASADENASLSELTA
jgi:hypothetical protein